MCKCRLHFPSYLIETRWSVNKTRSAFGPFEFLSVVKQVRFAQPSCVDRPNRLENNANVEEVSKFKFLCLSFNQQR